jgi:uncharacterized protein YkwD
MIFQKKNNIKILIISTIFLFGFFSFNEAHAGTLSATFSESFSSLFNFINTKIIGQIKNDFCRNYILSISNGDWKEGEFRTTLGRRVCTSYSAPSSISKITQTSLQTLNGNNVSNTEIPNAFSINNPTPDVFNQSLSSSGASLDANQIISLTNMERKNNDSSLVELKYNGILKNIAGIRVKDMFTYQYFEHNSPTGDNASKEAAKNGYTYITIGENIALGNFNGPTGLVTSWMNSPGHRANILNKNYTEIGVYTEKGTYKGQSVWIAAQIFGKPMLGCTNPDKTLKDKIAKYKVSADSMLTSINNIDAELKTLNVADTQTYNSKVAERNTLAGLYNNLASEIKTLVAEYNKEASIFNSCIKTL